MQKTTHHMNGGICALLTETQLVTLFIVFRFLIHRIGQIHRIKNRPLFVNWDWVIAKCMTKNGVSQVGLHELCSCEKHTLFR